MTKLDEIKKQVESLSITEQQELSLYIIQITQDYQMQSKSPDYLSQFAGMIGKDDLKLMSEAIYKDCGKVDASEW